MKSRGLPNFLFIASILFLALESPATAGYRELEAMLGSPAGRLILREMGFAEGVRIAESNSGALLKRAETSLSLLRKRYLATRPSDERIFEGQGGQSVLSRVQEEALREVIRREGFGGVYDLLYVEPSAREHGYSTKRSSFLDPSRKTPAPQPEVAGPSARTSIPPQGDAQKIREIARELVRASASQDPTERAELIRAVLAGHPELAIWAAERRDLAKLLREADLEIGSQEGSLMDIDAILRKGIRTQVESMAFALTLPAFAQLRTGIGQNTANLATLVLDPASPLGRSVSESALRSYAGLSYEARLSLLKSLGDAPALLAQENLDLAMTRVKVSEIPAVRQVFDARTGIDLSQFPKDKAELFEQLLTRYFDQMALADKRRVLQALLDLPAGASLQKKLAAVLQNSGPAAQKLFQLVGRDARGPLVRDVMAELLSNIRPVDGATVRKLIEKELGQSIDAVFSEFSSEPLAAASVGQVHLARLRHTGEKVVVKVLKPGVRDNALREIMTLKVIVGSTDFERDLVRNIEEALMRELDLRIEAQNLEKGSGYVSRVRSIAIAGPVEGMRVTENLLVQRLADGTVMSRLKAPIDLAKAATGLSKAEKSEALAELTRRGDAIEGLLGRWFERAVYGDGFFHADLHPGNLFYFKDPAGKAKPLLTMIDFGSADALTSAQRRGFIQFSIAAAMKSPDQALEALSRFSELPEGSRRAFTEGLVGLFAQKLGVVERVQQALLLSVQCNLRIPREIFMFVRGDLFLEKQLQEINRALDVLDPAAKVGRYDPIMTYLNVSSRHAALESPIQGLRLLPRKVRDYVFDFIGRDSDPRYSPEVFGPQTFESIWAASREKLLGAIK